MDLTRFIPENKRTSVTVIQSFLKDKDIATVTNVEAYYLWQSFSDSQCSTWLDVDDVSLYEFRDYLRSN